MGAKFDKPAADFAPVNPHHESAKPVVKSTGQRRRVSKRLLIVTLAVIFAVILALIVVMVSRDDKPAVKVAKTPVCSSKLLQRASKLFAPLYVSELEKSVNEIKKLPDFQSDPNCNYVLIMYAMNSGNLPDVKKYHDLFKQSYNPKKGLDKNIDAVAYSLPTLQKLVDASVKQQKEYSEQGVNP